MNIIIIDDEPVICNGISNLISNLNSEWIVKGVYYNSEEALELCDWDDVQLLLTDINMPEMDGLTLVDTLRERGYKTNVVFISGHTEFKYAQHALQQQAVDYILKPLSKDKIIDTLVKAEQRYMDDQMKLQQELCIKSNLLNYQKQFLADFIFETKKFSTEELKSSLKTFKLDQKCFDLIVFTTQRTKKVIEDNINQKLDYDMTFIYGSEYFYTLLIDITNRYMDINALLKQLVADSIIKKYQLIQNVRDIDRLPNLYNELLPLLKGDNMTPNDSKEGEMDVIRMDNKELSFPVKRSIEYIHNNYEKNLSLNILSSEVYVHPTYLSNLFRKETGYTVIDYINYYRILMAKKFLSETQNKVYWVTERVGFVNQRYFSQVFKKVTGMTPVQYKQIVYLNQN